MKQKTKLFAVLFTAAITIVFTACSKDDPRDEPSVSSGLVLDVDPGTDDATVMMLMKQYNCQPDWVVSTFGNATSDIVTRNACILTKALGLNSTVAKGAVTPYDGHEVTCGDFHGADGLANIADSLAAAYGVTDTIIASVKDIKQLADFICSKEEITYIAVGPLATLSHLIKEYPETEKHIKSVLVMGGGINEFNKDGDKEYNFAGDGIAVKNVFESSLNLTIFPLDITYHHARISKDVIDSYDYSKIPWYRNIFVQNWTSNVNTKQTTDEAVLHDCLPALYMIDSKSFEVETMKLTANEGGHIEPADNGRPVNVAKTAPAHYLENKIKEALTK